MVHKIDELLEDLESDGALTYGEFKQLFS